MKFSMLFSVVSIIVEAAGTVATDTHVIQPPKPAPRSMTSPSASSTMRVPSTFKNTLMLCWRPLDLGDEGE